MTPTKIFIDGAHGTTGLELREAITKHPQDFELLEFPASFSREERRDEVRRLQLAGTADIVVLCLPDDAALRMAENLGVEDPSPSGERSFVSDDLHRLASPPPSTKIAKTGSSLKATPRILDASSAHRTTQGWVYGFHELTGQAERIRNATRVSNPGCYAIGFISLIRPLIETKKLPADTALSVHGISGYSGGGRGLIEPVETDLSAWTERSYAPYALDLAHKHLREMHQHTGLTDAPLFQPAVVPVYRGMLLHVPLHRKILKDANLSAQTIFETLCEYYASFPATIRIDRLQDITTDLIDKKFLPLTLAAGTASLRIIVASNSNGDVMLHAALDNLGKGAAGNALKNLFLMREGLSKES